MPSRKPASSVLDGDGHDAVTPEPGADVEPVDPNDAQALAEVAEAEAVEAEAAATAARAKSRALKLRREADLAAAAHRAATLATPTVAEPVAAEQVAAEPLVDKAIDDTEDHDADEDRAEDLPAPARRRFAMPRLGLRHAAAALVVLLTLGLLGVSGWMIFQHRQAVAQQQHSAEFSAAARQGVVTLMSLNFNSAADDVKRIIDNTTGDFKKDFVSQAADFTKTAQDSKVITEATVNSTAVQSMSKDTATVLVAVTTNVSNAASKQQQPRSWRLRVDVARDGGQIKLAKVEFVP